MVSDMYSALLQELGSALKIKGLHPDSNNTCLIALTNGVKVYVEMDSKKEFVFIVAEIGAVAAGRYRENVLREAMKANGLPHPRNGTLGFSKQSGKLMMFERLNVRDLNGTKIASVLVPLSEKAKLWKDAVARNDVPTVSTVHTARVGMFGLK